MTSWDDFPILAFCTSMRTHIHTHTGLLVLQQARLLPLSLGLFCYAWGISGVPACETAPATCSSSQATACSQQDAPKGAEHTTSSIRLAQGVLQYHQSKELALDTLLAGIGCPEALILLVRGCVRACSSKHTHVRQRMCFSPSIQHHYL
jgi:hypothetical protein